MAKPANHIHRYKKVNLSRQESKEYFVYRCQMPNCTHYVPIDLAEGKLCLCNRCLEPMLIGKIQLNGSSGGPMAKPHCVACIQRKKVEEVDQVAEFLNLTRIVK